MKQVPIRVLCIRRCWWTTAAVLCAVIAMFAAVNLVPQAVGTGAAERQLPIYSVQRDQKVCSLSFDAAWGNVRVRPSVFNGLRAPGLKMGIF